LLPIVLLELLKPLHELLQALIWTHALPIRTDQPKELSGEGL
jgi:hypothetical protein